MIDPACTCAQRPSPSRCCHRRRRHGIALPLNVYVHLLLLLPSMAAGEKPIVYDREWRMHMPNPNLLRVPVGSGPDAIPATLVDLVADCGEYSPAKRPSMREVRGAGARVGRGECWATAAGMRTDSVLRH